MKNDIGEPICATKVDGCEIYSHEYNYCLRCESGKSLHASGSAVTCVATCPTNYTGKKEVYGDSDICIHDDDIDTANCPSGEFEFYNDASSTTVKLRCARCKYDATSTAADTEYFFINT